MVRDKGYSFFLEDQVYSINLYQNASTGNERQGVKKNITQDVIYDIS